MINENNIAKAYDILDMSNFGFNCFLCNIICSRIIDERYPPHYLLRIYAKTQAENKHGEVYTKEEYDKKFYEDMANRKNI